MRECNPKSVLEAWQHKGSHSRTPGYEYGRLRKAPWPYRSRRRESEPFYTQFPPAGQLSELFRELTTKWREDTKLSSSPTEVAMHPAYQRIIGLGPRILPYILREMDEGYSGHWFWALKAITGADPVKPHDRGRVKLMTRAWLEWAQQYGIQW